MIAFEIPYPATKRGKAAWNKRFGLNAYYAGKHWSQRKKDAEELHELAHWAMRKAGITKRLVNHPVKVTFSGMTIWTLTITARWAKPLWMR